MNEYRFVILDQLWAWIASFVPDKAAEPGASGCADR